MPPVDSSANRYPADAGRRCNRSGHRKGELTILVPRTRIADVLPMLRDDPAIAMNQLMDICGVDYPEAARQTVSMSSIICSASSIIGVSV